MLLSVGARAEDASAAIVLNEINCEGTDFVELVNTGATAVDLSGWLLTDQPLGSTDATHRMIFPTPTVIAASDDLVIERGAGGFPFGVSCGGDTIRLADGIETLVDEEFVPELTSATDTWGRYPNGTGDWQQTASTKGAPNQPSSATGDPEDDLAAWIFDPTAVYEIDLTLPQSSIDALAIDPEEYQDGTFSFRTTGGTYGPLDVGVRLKGHAPASRNLDAKAAFKVKFAHSVAGQRFLGLKTLTLNNMISDASEIHETLAYQAFRAAGVAAPRTGYAYVRVNGADYGLYLDVETVNNVFLPRWFDSTQHLYEGEFGADALPGMAGAFEVDEGNESDLADLEALIGAADYEGGDWFDRMEAVADLEQMTRMWAVEKYIGHWDSYAGGKWWTPFHPNNYFVHSDAAGRFSMVPWGTDTTWDTRLVFDGWAGHLFNKCVVDPVCGEIYVDAVHEVRGVIGSLDLDSQAVATANLLAPWQQIDPRRPHSPEEIAASVSATRAFISVRDDDVDSQDYWFLQDLVPPDTYFTRGPRPVVRTAARRKRVKLAFGSDEQATFKCRLDRRPWTPCRSPLTLLVSRGPHVMRARAQDLGGNMDATPAVHSWRVTRTAPAGRGAG